MTTEQDQTPKDNPSILDLAERLAASCREVNERIGKVEALLAEQGESAKANKAKLDAVADDALELIGQTLNEEGGEK